LGGVPGKTPDSGVRLVVGVGDQVGEGVIEGVWEGYWIVISGNGIRVIVTVEVGVRVTVGVRVGVGV
jgi:hypothetical protein